MFDADPTVWSHATPHRRLTFLALAATAAALLWGAACGGALKNDDLAGGTDMPIAVSVDRLSQEVWEDTGARCATAPCEAASRSVELKKVESQAPDIVGVENIGGSSFDLVPRQAGSARVTVVTRRNGRTTLSYEFRAIERITLSEPQGQPVEDVRNGEVYELNYRVYDSEQNQLLTANLSPWTATPSGAIERLPTSDLAGVAKFKILDASQDIVLKNQQGQPLFTFPVE